MATMCRRSCLLAVLLTWLVAAAGFAFRDCRAFESIPDLEAAMHSSVGSHACVRLLTVNGEAGCANPGRLPVSAPIQRLGSIHDAINGPRALLVPAALFQPLLESILAERSDPSSKGSARLARIVGVMVEGGDEGPLNYSSPAATFPQSDFAPYAAGDYQWNPYGTNILHKKFDFPVFLLTNESTPLFREKARSNLQRHFKPPLDVAEFRAVMQTTKSMTSSSADCLQRFSCLPLGGYSVLAALPPLPPSKQPNAFSSHLRVAAHTVSQPSNSSSSSSNSGGSPSATSAASGVSLAAAGSSTSSAAHTSRLEQEGGKEAEEEEKDLVLAIAALDASSFFRDVAPGADSPLSGLLALLGAIDALAAFPNHEPLKKQLAFFFAAGEDWGYMGSRQLLKQMGERGEAVRGFNSSRIAAVLEVGSVGRAVDPATGVSAVYAHTDKSSRAGKAAISTLFHYVHQAALSMNEDGIELKVLEPSQSSPGVPPSSLMTFIHEAPSVPGIVLEEFDNQFSNRFYQSRFDSREKLNISALTSVATLVARSLFILAGGSFAYARQIFANETLISNISLCLLTSSPGLACPLAASLMTPKSTKPNHYVGVFLGLPDGFAYPEMVSDTARFVYNFVGMRLSRAPLAFKTKEEAQKADWTQGEAEECTVVCEKEEEVCVGARREHKGVCVTATTRYVPSFSPRLAYTSQWTIEPPRKENAMDHVDRVWTESFWQQIELQSYLQDDVSTDGVILVIGIVYFTFCFIVVGFAKDNLRHHLKDM